MNQGVAIFLVSETGSILPITVSQGIFVSSQEFLQEMSRPASFHLSDLAKRTIKT
jgi:hypothetical protein